MVSLVEGVAFQNSSYNFSLPENQQAGVMVGKVWASSGSDLYDVAYTLKTHTDVFSLNANGAILTKTELDKEKQEWYILDVEAVDTRSPPTTAIAMVRPVLSQFIYILIQRTLRPHSHPLLTCDLYCINKHYYLLIVPNCDLISN